MAQNMSVVIVLTLEVERIRKYYKTYTNEAKTKMHVFEGVKLKSQIAKWNENYQNSHILLFKYMW